MLHAVPMRSLVERGVPCTSVEQVHGLARRPVHSPLGPARGQFVVPQKGRLPGRQTCYAGEQNGTSSTVVTTSRDGDSPVAWSSGSARLSADGQSVIIDNAPTPRSQANLHKQIQQLHAELEQRTREQHVAELRAQNAEQLALEARKALSHAQQVSSLLGEQYQVLCEKVEQMRLGISTDSSNSSSQDIKTSPSSSRAQASSPDIKKLQDQLSDAEYRLEWTTRDLRAHELMLEAQAEVALHLSGLPHDVEEQVAKQVDQQGRVLGDGGTATVYAVSINGTRYAVKVVPLGDIDTARAHHLRDLCTVTMPLPQNSFLERPLHTWLRVRDDGKFGTEYHLCTLWHRRSCDVHQLLASRPLSMQELLIIMYHTTAALNDLAEARMVHADVKPPNVLVMLGDDGRDDKQVMSAHLADLGSVQFIPAGSKTTRSIWDGAIAWNWPPEQREFVYLEKCDVWALAMLYSCLRHSNPPSQRVIDTLQDVNVDQSEFERVRDRDLLPHLKDDPPELRALTTLMRRCIVQDPSKRPTMSEIVTATERAYRVITNQAPLQNGRSIGSALKTPGFWARGKW